MTPMMRRARCCMAWTPCHPSSDATSTKITAGSSRSSVNGRSSFARRQHHRESRQPLQSPPTPAQLIHTKRRLSQSCSLEHPLQSQIREPLRRLNQNQKQRRSQSLIPVRRGKVCCGDWREEDRAKCTFMVIITNYLCGRKGILPVVMNECYNI